MIGGCKMSELVFCGKCKYKRLVEAAMGCFGYLCKKNPRTIITSFHSYEQEEQCEVKNANNDCPDFEKKGSLL